MFIKPHHVLNTQNGKRTGNRVHLLLLIDLHTNVTVNKQQLMTGGPLGLLPLQFILKTRKPLIAFDLDRPYAPILLRTAIRPVNGLARGSDPKPDLHLIRNSSVYT